LREAAEACAAGVTALVIVVANGAPIEGPATAAVAFSLGAIFMVIGTALARRLPTLGVDEANV
jgi:putative N-acetylmannosamine-6-phosphate epimerase